MTTENKIEKLKRKELVVFDFDETLVDCNSDTWIHQLGPDRTIPKKLLYKEGQDYLEHVQIVLDYLHSQKITKQDYISCLSKMPQVDDMIDTLIKNLGQYRDKYDMIILSDANSFFISTFLEALSISNLFLAILTNSSVFNDDGQLILNGYHVQEYCPISSRNLCKGEALKDFIAKQMLYHNTVYTCINYIGDGENDLCPSTKLSNKDRIFPRKNFPLDRLCLKLEKSLTDTNGNSSERTSDKLNTIVANLKAPVFTWSDGKDILKIIMPNVPVDTNNNNVTRDE